MRTVGLERAGELIGVPPEQKDCTCNPGAGSSASPPPPENHEGRRRHAGQKGPHPTCGLLGSSERRAAISRSGYPGVRRRYEA